MEGTFLLFNGDFTGAQKELLRAPEGMLRNFFLGCADIGLGKYSEGNSQWQLSVLNELPYTQIGLALLDEKKYSGALMFFQSADRFNPDYPPTLIYLNNTYMDLGDKQSALMVIQQAEQIAPDGWVVLMTLAGTQWWVGQQEQAIQTWYRVLRLYPDTGADVYTNLANALVGFHHDERGALKLLARALSYWPEDQTIYTQISDIYFGYGRQEAGTYWRKQAESINRDPQPAEFLEGLIIFYTGDIPSACLAFQHVLNEHPDHSGAREWYSQCP